jgi:hypothetical protein
VEKLVLGAYPTVAFQPGRANVIDVFEVRRS